MKLDSWLKGEHSTAERIQLVAGLCAVVDAAHKRGAALGVLDPAAIEVEPGGRCRLDPDSSSVGSAYAAPELAQTGVPTVKTDVYSAGLICYEVLAGKAAARTRPRPPLRDLQPDVAGDLADAVTACIEEDAEWRPSDLSFVLKLASSLSGSAADRPAPARTGGAKRPPSSLLDGAPRAAAPARGRGLRLAVLGVVLAAAAGAGIWLVLHPSHGERDPSARRSVPAPPTTVAEALPASPDAAGTPPPSSPMPDKPAANSSRSPAASPAPSTSPSARPTSSPSAVAARPAPTPSAPVATGTPAAPAPTPTAVAREVAVLAAPTPAPAQITSSPPAEPGEAPAGPPGITAVSPFRLRAGALHALDVHGTGLRADLRLNVASPRRREAAPGFSATRYQLRGSGLLLVFLKVEPDVRPGKYAITLVGPNGDESNPFTIEIVK